MCCEVIWSQSVVLIYLPEQVLSAQFSSPPGATPFEDDVCDPLGERLAPSLPLALDSAVPCPIDIEHEVRLQALPPPLHAIFLGKDFWAPPF